VANGVNPRVLLTVLGVAGSLVALYSFSQGRKAPRRLALMPGRVYRWTFQLEGVDEPQAALAVVPLVAQVIPEAANVETSSKRGKHFVSWDAPAVDDSIELPQAVPGLPGAIVRVDEP